ncbi:MAG: DUF2304 domain-containing protein [Nitrosospira sp.]|nr:DUF2304 domain-containing protein [Nitrosospira sp.]
MTAQHWTSAAIAIAVAAIIVWLVRHDRIHPRIAGWWVLVACAIVVIGVFPGSFDWLAHKLGVDYSPTLTGILAMAAVLIKMVSTDISRSKDKQKLRVLAQRTALLEAQLGLRASEQSLGESGTTQSPEERGKVAYTKTNRTTGPVVAAGYGQLETSKTEHETRTKT